MAEVAQWADDAGVTARYLLPELPRHVDEEHIYNYFSALGEIEEVTVKHLGGGKRMGSVKFIGPTTELRNLMLGEAHVLEGTPVAVMTWKMQKLQKPGYQAKRTAELQVGATKGGKAGLVPLSFSGKGWADSGYAGKGGWDAGNYGRYGPGADAGYGSKGLAKAWSAQRDGAWGDAWQGDWGGHAAASPGTFGKSSPSYSGKTGAAYSAKGGPSCYGPTYAASCQQGRSSPYGGPPSGYGKPAGRYEKGGGGKAWGGYGGYDAYAGGPYGPLGGKCAANGCKGGYGNGAGQSGWWDGWGPEYGVYGPPYAGKGAAAGGKGTAGKAYGKKGPDELEVTARYLLSDLPEGTSEESLQSYFGTFAEIEEITLKVLGSTGALVGSVKFSAPTLELRNIMLKEAHEIEGQRVTVETWKMRKLARPAAGPWAGGEGGR